MRGYTCRPALSFSSKPTWLALPGARGGWESGNAGMECKFKGFRACGVLWGGHGMEDLPLSYYA